MLATAIIIFREILEIALVVGVVMAASEGAPHRNRWVALGLLLGCLGAGGVALSAASLAEAMEGTAQDLFAAGVQASAALLIAWTVVWMKTQGREMAARLKAAGRAVALGETPLHVLTLVVALAVLREGAEAVLFLSGILTARPDQWAQVVTGGMLGLGAGIIVGVSLYLGLLSVAARTLFSVTGVLLSLLAAGMAAGAAGSLTAAQWLPPLIDQVWDSSALLSGDSLAGRVLGVLIGYQERPSGLQLAFYLATLLAILSGQRLCKPSVRPERVRN